jgi:hypothetical protein
MDGQDFDRLGFTAAMGPNRRCVLVALVANMLAIADERDQEDRNPCVTAVKPTTCQDSDYVTTALPLVRNEDESGCLQA